MGRNVDLVCLPWLAAQIPNRPELSKNASLGLLAFPPAPETARAEVDKSFDKVADKVDGM
jgi:hypothetical protein